MYNVGRLLFYLHNLFPLSNHGSLIRAYLLKIFFYTQPGTSTQAQPVSSYLDQPGTSKIIIHPGSSSIIPPGSCSLDQPDSGVLFQPVSDFQSDFFK